MGKKPKLDDFLNTIFDKKECIWINDSVKGKPLSEKITHWDTDFLETCDCINGLFFVLHPAEEQELKRHGDNSKGIYRNFLIEFDDISIEEQKELVEELKLPYTSAVFSGNKSIHYIISLEDGLDYDEYSKYFKYLQELTLCDTANKDKVRYSRLPFCKRDGVKQELLELNERISNEDFINWISSPKIKKTRMINSYELEAKKRKQCKRNTNKESGSREDVKELLMWYVHEYLGKPEMGEDYMVQCPVCEQDGHDNACDNLIVNFPDYSFRCWYDPEEHDRRLLAVISKLMNPEKKRKTKW